VFEAFDYYFPLKIRFPLGILAFIILAIIDFKKFGWKSERLREYSFLFFCALLAIFYAVINDMITSSISEEYFIKGKGILSGPGFKWRVAWIAVKGSYWVGLLSGVALLIANNKYKNFPRVSMVKLLQYSVLPVLFAIFTSVIFYFLNINESNVVLYGVDNAAAFNTVMETHRGAYIGGLIGTVLAVVLLIKSRFKLKGLLNISTSLFV